MFTGGAGFSQIDLGFPGKGGIEQAVGPLATVAPDARHACEKICAAWDISLCAMQSWIRDTCPLRARSGWERDIVHRVFLTISL